MPQCSQGLLTQRAYILISVLLQDFLAEHLLLNAIVTVEDAKHIEQHLDEEKSEGVEDEARPRSNRFADP